MALPRLTAAVVAAMTPLLAHAAPAPSAEQAASLQQQTQKFLSDMTGGAFAIPPDAVTFTPDGDHYLVSVPLAKIGAVEPKDAAFTAKARMIDDTRWSIDDQHLPPSFRLTVDTPVPNPPDLKKPDPKKPDPKKPDPKASAAIATHTERVTYVVTIGAQTSHATFDPTYATATSSEGTLEAVDIRTEGGSTPSSQHWDHYASQTSVRPAAPGQADLLVDSTIDGVTSNSTTPDGAQAKTTARRVHVIGSMTGVEHARLAPLMAQLVALVKASPAKGAKPETPAEKAAASAAARKLLASAHELMTGGRIEETAETVAFDIGGHAGSVDKATLVVGADAPKDMLAGTMTLLLDGLTLPELPPAFVSYVPKHILLTPTVSNLSAADLTQMADAYLAQPAAKGAAPPPIDPAVLFSHGGIVLGLDALGLDIAGAQFTGTGKFTMTGPAAITGQAEVSAHGLDALVTQVQADPLLAQGVPVLIFLKGIAHVTGDQAVWQIAVADTKVTVNGVDLSALAGGMR